jgi:head-tail adaptor
MMQAGRMDRRLRIEKGIRSQSITSGEATIGSWLPVARPWAELVELRGLERVLAQQMAARIDVVWRIRWIDIFALGPEETFRIIEEATGRIYDIVSITERGGRKVGLDIGAQARAETEVAA